MGYLGRSFGKARLLWDPADVTGCTFALDGRPGNVEDVQHMLVTVYERACHVLFDFVLFGLSLETLEFSLDWSKLNDSCRNSGRNSIGLLDLEAVAAHRSSLWNAKSDFFFNPDGESVAPNRPNWRTWMQHLEVFKWYLYFLTRFTCGLPRRLTEEVAMKLRDLPPRSRNFFSPFGRLEVVGEYSKTSSTLLRDNETLGFAPTAVGKLFLVYIALCNFIEGYYIRKIHDGPTDENWDAYWLQSYGKRWTDVQLSSYIMRTSVTHLGQRFGPADFRQILPSMVDQFGLGTKNTTTPSVGHYGSGHNINVKERHYALLMNDIPGLTASMRRDMYWFSEEYHEFFGFDGETPRRLTALEMWHRSRPKNDPLLLRLYEVIENSRFTLTLAPANLPLTPSAQVRLPIMPNMDSERGALLATVLSFAFD